METAKLEAYLALQQRSQVILETSAEAFAVADGATKHGHQVSVVPSALAPLLGVGEHGLKSDQRDARALSKASCTVELRSVHISSAESRELKSMCGMRDSLVRARTQLINCVRGYLRTQLVRIRSGTPVTFPERVREKLLQRAEGLSGFVERLLVSIEELTRQITDATKQLAKIARNDETCRRLMTVPGVGPVVAIRFSAALDSVDRFPGPHAVESYLGLTPRENSSGEREKRGAITKAGPSALRWTLCQAAWSAMRSRSRKDDPMIKWARQVALRRGNCIAMIALARKISGILFALWRDKAQYDPCYAFKSKSGFEGEMAP